MIYSLSYEPPCFPTGDTEKGVGNQRVPRDTQPLQEGTTMRIREGPMAYPISMSAMLIPFGPKNRSLDLGRQTDGEGDDDTIGDSNATQAG